ncbi:MAG: flavin-dependent dehydrogenase, partial [Oscillatoriales cyanobacterium]
LTAAWRTPVLLWWIFDMAGPVSLLRWVGTYLSFTWQSLIGFLLGWLPAIEHPLRKLLADRYPRVWLRVLSTIYAVTEGIGRPYRSRSVI